MIITAASLRLLLSLVGTATYKAWIPLSQRLWGDGAPIYNLNGTKVQPAHTAALHLLMGGQQKTQRLAGASSVQTRHFD
jgi:hypothetical protein